MMAVCLLASSVAAQRLHVGFVPGDDHALQAVSAYGGYLKNHARTPTIQGFADEGMRFDRFACNNSICSPGRACCLTGPYSHQNGVLLWRGSNNESSPQDPVGLQRAG